MSARPATNVIPLVTAGPATAQTASPAHVVGAASDSFDVPTETRRTGRPTRLLITDTVVLNTGDAAILMGAIRAIHAAFGDAVEIEVADLQPAAAARYYPEFRFLPTIHACVADWAGEHGLRYKLAAAAALLAAATWKSKIAAPLRMILPAELRRVLARYASADVIIAAGGTYLVPHYRLMPRIVNFLASTMMRKPLILFTQSLGPFRPSISRFLLRTVLRRACLILVRDDASRRHLQALGISPERAILSPDAAFALAPASTCECRPHPSGAPLHLAISLRNWPHFRNIDREEGMSSYLDAVAGLVRYAVEALGARVTFLSTCQGAREYWTDDSAVADQVAQLLPLEVLRNVEIDRLHRRPENLIRRLSDFDVVVATRMHAAILSLCAGRPVLAIGYEFKTRELFRRLGIGDKIVDIEEVSDERLIAALNDLLDHRAALAEPLARRIAAERRSALAAGNLVRQALREAGIPVWQPH